MSQTLFDKLWATHCVSDFGDGSALLLIDRIFLHERTGSVALQSLADHGRKVAHPAQAFCTMDHIIDTTPGRGDATAMPGGSDFIKTTRRMADASGIRLFDIGDNAQGIVHVISPELGIVLPGLTLVCPDSHTCTQGAFGALAWGIGSTEAEHALATQTLQMNRPKNMRIRFNGKLPAGVTAKDLILYLIARFGTAGGAGHVVEFAGEAVRAMDMESRMTLCNMAVEFSAVTGLIAPDTTTLAYLKGREFAPKGAMWEKAVTDWHDLKSDTDAIFDAEIDIDVSALTPMVTWGTSPQDTVAIDGAVPNPAAESDANRRAAMERAQNYMDVTPGTPMTNLKIDAAFIGSCTNSRLSDLRRAAAILKGRKVATGVKAICVPGSTAVKHQAEAEGLDLIFKQAGFEWRESGCSMCFFAGGESFGFRQRVVTSTNRNFESRQGPETRSHLASPETVAASAIAGHLASAQSITKEA